MNTTKLNAVIPFSGFYNSTHSDLLDREEEQLFQDDRGDVWPVLARQVYDVTNYRAVMNQYAARYVANFAELIGVPMQFETVHSPREYNFTTDRIYVFIEYAHVARMLAAVQADPTEMDRIAQERHTSRDGFISYYRPAWTTWGALCDWEPEQLHTLIQAFTAMHPDVSEDWEAYLMDQESESGALVNIVCANLTERGERLLRIADKLRARAERQNV